MRIILPCVGEFWRCDLILCWKCSQEGNKKFAVSMLDIIGAFMNVIIHIYVIHLLVSYTDTHTLSFGVCVSWHLTGTQIKININKAMLSHVLSPYMQYACSMRQMADLGIYLKLNGVKKKEHDVKLCVCF